MKFGTLLACSFLILVAVGCSSGSGSDSDGLRVVTDKKPEGGVVMDKDEMAKKSGLPIYPGSEVPDGQSTVTNAVTESKYLMVMTTKDPIKKVMDYYKSKLPSLSGGMNNGKADLLGLTSSKAPVHLVIGAKDGTTTISATAIVEIAAAKP